MKVSKTRTKLPPLIGLPFVIPDEHGEPALYGQIVALISVDTYLVKLGLWHAGGAITMRVRTLDEMGAWLFFDDDSHLRRWDRDRIRKAR